MSITASATENRLYSRGSREGTSGTMPVFGQSRVKSGENFAAQVKTDQVETAERPVKADPKTMEALQGTHGKKSGGKEDKFTFWDFLDIINPLQHIPVIATIYRAMTGDEIKPASRVLGDGLYGGPVGMAAGLVSAMVEETTGKDIGAHALAMVIPDKKGGQETMFAQNELKSIETAAGSEDVISLKASQETSELALSASTPDHTGQVTSIRPAGHTPPPPAMSANTTTVSLTQGDGQTKIVAGAIISPEVDIKASDALAAPGEAGVPPERIADAMMKALDKYEALKKQQWGSDVYNRNDNQLQVIRPKLDLVY